MEFNCENCGWSKVIGSPIFCEYSEKRTFRENCCEAWKPKNNPVTNADKIRKMSDEELADFIGGIFTLDSDVWGDYDPRTVVMQEPRVEVRNKEEMLEWLKREVESDG